MNPVRISTVCLVLVGLADLASSLFWLSRGYGEGNPLFARLAQMGSIPFALGKVAMLAGPILLLEYARKSHPKSADQGTWLATAFYILLLAIHIRAVFGS